MGERHERWVTAPRGSGRAGRAAVHGVRVAALGVAALFALSPVVARAGNENGGALAGGKAAAPPPPTPDVRLRLIAPSAQGRWTMRVENHGSEVVRIPAEVRLMRIEIRPLSNDQWSKRAQKCDGPAAFGLDKEFPVERELYLQPGEAYTETFDPRLFCFGKNAPALAGGTLVKATWGWDPAPRWAKGEREPYAVDGVKYPRPFTPQKQLEAPTILLSFFPPEPPGPPPKDNSLAAAQAPGEAKDGDHADGAKGDDTSAASGGDAAGAPGGGDKAGSDDAAHAGEAPEPSEGPLSGRPKPAPVVDELEPKLVLEAQRYADGRYPREVALRIDAVNRGHRELYAAVRNRQLSFDLHGPDGTRTCEPSIDDSKVARDHFRRLRPDQKAAMVVLVAEHCPPETFDRPGLYELVPTLHPDDAAKDHGLHVFLDDAKSEQSILVRIQRSRKSFYKRPPRAEKMPVEPRPGVYDDPPAGPNALPGLGPASGDDTDR